MLINVFIKQAPLCRVQGGFEPAIKQDDPTIGFGLDLLTSITSPE